MAKHQLKQEVIEERDNAIENLREATKVNAELQQKLAVLQKNSDAAAELDRQLRVQKEANEHLQNTNAQLKSAIKTMQENGERDDRLIRVIENMVVVTNNIATMKNEKN